MSTRRRVFSGTPLTVRRPSPPALLGAALAALLAGGAVPAAAQDRPPPRAPSEQPTLHVVRRDVDDDGVLDRVVVVRIRRGERVIDWGVVYSGATGERIISDRRETTPSPDLTGDGLVDQADIAAMLGVYGEAVAPGGSGDLDFDGRVDVQDLSRLLARFGQTPPAGGVPPTPLDCVLYCPGEPFPVCQGCGDADGGDSTDGGDGISTVGEGLTDDPDGTGDDDDGGGGGFCCDTDGDGDPDDDDDGVPDSQDSSPEGCEASDQTEPGGTANLNLVPFDNALTQALVNAVPWVVSFDINVDSEFDATLSQVCCGGDPTPKDKLTFDDLNDASANISFAFPLASGDIGFEIPGLAKFAAGYSVGPQLEASVDGVVSASGTAIAGDCPQCLQFDTDLNVALTGSFGGEAHMTVLLTDLAGRWGGTNCQPGFEFVAEASAGVSASANVFAAFNGSNCTTAAPGFAGGDVSFRGIEGMLTVSFQSIHGESREFEIGHQTVTFVAPDNISL